MATIKKIKETDIQKAVCDYLALKKYFFWRQNNNPIYSQGRMFAMPKYSMHGVPDIILIKDGFFIGLEIKTSTGKQSEHQKEFQRKCKENGAEYYVIKSLEDIKEIGL